MSDRILGQIVRKVLN